MPTPSKLAVMFSIEVCRVTFTIQTTLWAVLRSSYVLTMPATRKYAVIAPLELSTFSAQPPALSAGIVHGPITYGSDAVPDPPVTQAHAAKSALEVIVIAACQGGSDADCAIPPGSPSASSVPAATAIMVRRRRAMRPSHF